MANLTTSSQTLHNSKVLTNLNIKVFTLSLSFSIYFKDLLYNKHILITQSNLNINSNRLDFCLHLYFRKKKLIKFKKFNLKKTSNIKSIKDNVLFFLLKNIQQKFEVNSINLNLIVLNKRIIFPFFFRTLKKKIKFFKKSLFERRFNLYSDFLKLTVLYQMGQVSIDSFVLILGEIFQRLSKIKHGRFLKFIKILFKDILLEYQNERFFNTIKGAKFIISGKIRGKLRAKMTSIYFGSVPISTQSKHVQFSKTHVYTVYGSYGIKLWVYQGFSRKKDFTRILKRFNLIRRKFRQLKKLKKLTQRSDKLFKTFPLINNYEKKKSKNKIKIVRSYKEKISK